MSSPSTPRSTRSASPPAGSPDILTPGRKVKAMMAQFDSDSESEPDNNKSTAQPIRKLNLTDNTSTNDQPPTRVANADSDDDDDDIAIPKGRMAARMQAASQSENTEEPNKTTETAFDRVSKTLRAGKDQEGTGAQSGSNNDTNDGGEGDAMQSSDDDLPMAGPRRRAAKGKKQSEDDEEASNRSLSRERSFSPLFMSSPRSQRADNTRGPDGSDGSGDDEAEPQPKDNPRLRALVAQKRKEREERERIEKEKKAARAAQQEQFSSEVLSGEGSGDDGGSGRKLTQQARPSRKASKKALEEMHRETQRMSRNMQLTHQAQTKKKITKESFFARFNFGKPQTETAPTQPAEHSSSTTGSQNSSDVEAQKDRETPRTSPVLGPVDKEAGGDSTGGKENDNTELAELPPIEEILAGTYLQNEEPVVARAEVQKEGPPPKAPTPKAERKTLKKPPVRVQLSRQSVAQHQKDDSDSDELEVVTSPAKCRRIAAFENLPTKKMEEPESFTKLKALAHISSPSRQRASVNFAQHSAGLLARAKQQAAQERKDRIEELRAKGIVVETAQERAAMEDDIENLVEKARKEADDIAKEERKASKKEGGQDDEDDDDADFELSGSENEEGNGDEDEEEEEEEEENAQAGVNNDEGGFLDAEAGEDDASADGQSEAMSADEGDIPTARRKRPTRVVSDDEDDDEPRAPTTPAKPMTPNKSSAETPGFPIMPGSGNLTMGLTQAFAGTLGGSQQGSLPNSPGFIPTLPDPEIGAADAQPGSQMIVKDSQGQPTETTTDIFARYAPSEAEASESHGIREMSEFSQIPEATQDAGFVFSPFDPSKRFRDLPPSTVETVPVGQSQPPDSPIPQRKGKHLRRGRADDGKSATEDQSNGDFEVDASAFDVLKKASKKKASVPFDKQKSKAKDVVEEAADESDDEYAGLGGGSDDSEGEEDGYDEQMINDNSGEKVDEKQLAALNAVHSRDADGKQVAKLLQDITTGALRRRKGADDDLDLDDPADELLARRREKQRDFARMRRALLADDKVNEIAENPKKAAFFKAIEDRDDEDDVDLDFLEYEKQDASQEESPSQEVAPEGQQQQGPATSDSDNKRKRPLEPSAQDIANRPPPHLRRKPASAMSKKPATLAEIRETVSFLTETHEYDSFHEDAAVEGEEDHAEQMDEDQPETPAEDDGAAPNNPKEDSFIPRTHNHNHPRRTRGPVVDRLALLRQASSNSATTASASTRFAFHAGAGKDPAANIGFRPPPLLRKTTNGSSASGSSSSTADSRRAAKAPPGSAAISKKGAVNYYTAAREQERERSIRAKERSGGSNIAALLNKHGSNRLGALGKGQWD